MTKLSMAAWKDGLWSQFFDDPTGDGRHVSILHVNNALFGRVAHQQGLSLSDLAARQSFLAAFPARLEVQRWLAGSRDPGEALLPLLVLCCLAASEAAESEDEDYRGRMRDLMGWDEKIIDYAALPKLWQRLARHTIERARRVPTRTLTLPDPRHRTQIGHAIELTFPSRNDARKLVQELTGEQIDLDAPRAVLAWLSPLVARKRFSTSFQKTFEDFSKAWMAAERALSDHRFWSGWQLATRPLRETAAIDPFEIVADEWGGRHLIDAASGTPIDLEGALKARDFPPQLTVAAIRSHVIPLVESEWGKLRWIGSGHSRSPDALLIRERAFNSRHEALGCVPVSGADGWALTYDITGALGARVLTRDRDRLLDVCLKGCTRTDGGVLARPALPFTIETVGFVDAVSLRGDVAHLLSLDRLGPDTWRVTPIEPVEGDVRIVVVPRSGEQIL